LRFNKLDFNCLQLQVMLIRFGSIHISTNRTVRMFPSIEKDGRRGVFPNGYLSQKKVKRAISR